MQVIDDDGRIMDAECSLELEGAAVALVMESTSGRSGTRPPKNPDYMQLLGLLLSRLGNLRAVLLDALVDSGTTRAMGLSEQQRRILASRPLALGDVSDMDELRRELTRTAGRAGQAPGARKEGNRTKRIRLILDVPEYGSDLVRLAADLETGTGSTREPNAAGSPGTSEASPGLPDDRAEPAARTRVGGAGYLADAKVRKAVEDCAVRQAVDWYSALGYEVQDVGTTRSYDLHMTRDGEVLHVEVKGSIQTAESVELTVNEVHHARQADTHLFVVDQIQYVRLDDGMIRAYGGRVRVWSGWQPAEADLTSTRFRYRLPADAPTTSLPQ